jgi:ABC exporter DevA family ATP-binding subunit
MVSLTWLVLQKTASGLAVGTVLVAAAIPRALFMLVGGAISDRWSPRNVAIIGGLINTFLIGIATVLLILDGFNLIVFIVIAVLFGLFEAILYPAILALLPQLVRKSQLAEANAWIQGSEQFTEVIGPAGAGFMIGAFGLTIAFAINTLIFAFGGLFIYLVRTRHRQPLATEPEKQALTGEIVLGLKYAWTQPAIRISLLLLAMINFAMLGPIIIGVAALVNVKFGGNATTFGYLQSAYGIGALLGVLVASQMGAIKSLKTPLVLLCYGLGAGLIALGFVQDFWIASGIIALMGIGGGTVTVLGMTWLQQNTASNMQGRMMGLTMFAAVALDPFSQGVSGVLVEFSLTGLFVAAGVTMFLTAIASSIGRTHTIKSVTTDSSFPVSEPVISVRNLNHYFGSGMLRKQVLFDINLDIQPGEIVIMTGPSGSGKTTLLTLMGGLRSAQEGSLKILGQEICGANKQHLTKLRRQIGYIFQAHNLMTFLTTQENVRMSLELHDEYLNHDINNKAIAMLESVGLGDRISYYPENLSGGQKQRVAIARALVSQPKIVLADEPTAALDKKSGRDVVELMQKLAKEQGCTILLVTHDNRILDIADRIIYMEDGQLKDVNIKAKIQ